MRQWTPQLKRARRWGGWQHAKVDEAKVLEMRQRYAAGLAGTGPRVFQHQLAAEYGIGKAQAGEILRGQAWRHVQ